MSVNQSVSVITLSLHQSVCVSQPACQSVIQSARRSVSQWVIHSVSVSVVGQSLSQCVCHSVSDLAGHGQSVRYWDISQSDLIKNMYGSLSVCVFVLRRVFHISFNLYAQSILNNINQTAYIYLHYLLEYCGSKCQIMSTTRQCFSQINLPITVRKKRVNEISVQYIIPSGA